MPLAFLVSSKCHLLNQQKSFGSKGGKTTYKVIKKEDNFPSKMLTVLTEVTRQRDKGKRIMGAGKEW